MAPPIPGLRQPTTASRRTASDVLLGVLAVLALAALTIGVPVALAAVFGLPIPHKLPSASVLTQQLDVMSVLRVVAVVVWLAWIQLVWCVIVEIRAAIRNVGVPDRVPLASPAQSLAHRLVTAALLLFSATATLSPAFAHAAPHAGPPRPAYSVSAQAQLPGYHSQAPGQEAPPLAPPRHASPTAEKIYVVEPPAGRHHESLWEIAQHHLGDGRRYREIFELNSGHVQPDGNKLTIASLIRPGWVLRMPGDAFGPGVETVGAHADAGRGAGGGGGTTVRSEEKFLATPTTASGGTAGSGAVAAHQQTARWPYELASAGLLAAGVLAALGRRRRELLWQRAFGRRLAVPEGDAAVAEEALRLGADDPAVQLLDTSLRQLSAALAAQQKPLPTVFAAHLGEGHLDLWVAPPDPSPPQPWLVPDGGQVWRMPAAAAATIESADALAPYPGLVSLGMNGTGRVMVDLEVAHGLIAVRGPADKVRAALAALAVELVTNRWSDRMRVTLVGFGEGLDALSPERVVLANSLEEVLPELERRAAELTDQLSQWGIDSVLTGRLVSRYADTWAPHYLIMGVPPTPAQAERLLALARTRHRTALGFVVADDVPGASWTWDLTPDGRLRTDMLGFDLAAQLLLPEQYAAVISLFRGSGGDAPVSPPAVGAAPAAHLLPETRVTVEVGLLGPVTVSAPGPVEQERVALATELVVYLAAHPAGVHRNVLAGALWPRGAPAEVRDATLARVRQWLGTDASGQPNLVAEADGRLRLGPGVRVDWQVFRALVAQTDAASAAAAAGQLERALDLIRGQLLDGRDPGRYAWLATDDFCYEVTALVADTAHRLSALRLAWGDADGAMAAARAGLLLAFDDELLWRDLLHAAHATGQEQVLRSAVDEISARVALDEVMPRMAPETEALIDELLPSWRQSAA
jgi:DNA-binding SARP family transcriptional activator